MFYVTVSYVSLFFQKNAEVCLRFFTFPDRILHFLNNIIIIIIIILMLALQPTISFSLISMFTFFTLPYRLLHFLNIIIIIIIIIIILMLALQPSIGFSLMSMFTFFHITGQIIAFLNIIIIIIIIILMLALQPTISFSLFGDFLPFRPFFVQFSLPSYSHRLDIFLNIFNPSFPWFPSDSPTHWNNNNIY